MCCAIGLAGAFVWVLLAGSNAGATSSISSNGSGASSSLVSPTIGGSGASTDGISTSPLGSLVVPGVDELAGGELARDQHQARLMNPEAVGLREVSRTKFENLSARQAVKLAGEAFPAVIDHPVGGPPQLPSGERIVGYVANNAAAVALPEGKHGVVESLQPIAVPSGHGHFAPIDLGLRQSGDGYTPTTSDVGVQIPTQLSEGIGMPADGVSLTPVSASGQPLAGSQGAVDGASVLYANTQTDTDTIAKPTTGGFEIDSLLRSVDSPTTLYFRVGMPAGAKLVNDTGPGGARVVLDGETIAAIAAISAQDAEGTSVPVKMRATDGTLAVDVATGSVNTTIRSTSIRVLMTKRSGSRAQVKVRPKPIWKAIVKPTGGFTTKEEASESIWAQGPLWKRSAASAIKSMTNSGMERTGRRVSASSRRKAPLE